MRRNAEFIKTIRATAVERTDRSTALIRDTAVNRMSRTGEGERHSGSARRSSGPGESPVSQSGELASSLQNYPAVDRGDVIEGAAGTDLYRLVFLERGTKSVQPRPLLLPSLLQSKPGVMAIMGGADG